MNITSTPVHFINKSVKDSMTIRKIYCIVAAMTLSLLGLIGVQLWWIDTAINVKEARFTQNVTEALGVCVHSVEVQESARALTEEITKKDTIAAAPTIKLKKKARKRNEFHAPEMVDTPTYPPMHQIKMPRVFIPPLPNEIQNHPLSPRSPLVFTRIHQSNGTEQYAQSNTDVNSGYTSQNNDEHSVTAFNYNNNLLATQQLNEQQSLNLNQQRFRNSRSQLKSRDTIIGGKIHKLQKINDSLNRIITINGDKNSIRIATQNGQYTLNSSNNYSILYSVKDSESHNAAIAHSTTTRDKNEEIVKKVMLHLEESEPEFWMNVEDPEVPPAPELDIQYSHFTKQKAQKVHRKLTATAEKIQNVVSRKVDLDNAIATKLMCEIQDPKTIQQRVAATALDSLLKKQLREKGILLQCEYAVILDKNDSVLMANTPDVRTETKKSHYAAAMFPNDIIPKNYSLRVFFPNQKSYILESLWALMATSGVFLSIIIATFGFTVVAFVRQKKLSDMKTDFINNMTHEFQTPIATISLASEALRDGSIASNEDRRSRFVNVIFDENKRLGKQVELILQAAALEKGKYTINLKEIDIHQIVLSAVQHISMQVEKKGGNIYCHLDAIRSISHADEAHISNILHNLLDNACKYSHNIPEIIVTTTGSVEGITISIQDNGIGMTRDQQKRAFERFYRVPTGNRHDVKGFGLGLSYVRSMVEAHGGNVSVQSELGKGSIFKVFLPFKNII
ncbi:MAG: HAMP domain-containing histidine kinase [Ignavibacteriae bacterium]|nr:HAMP domain-containing histidine kinase [Ignavibacteriota bacterium]